MRAIPDQGYNSLVYHTFYLKDFGMSWIAGTVFLLREETWLHMAFLHSEPTCAKQDFSNLGLG